MSTALICRLFIPLFLLDLKLELNIVAVFGATFALVSLSARMMTVLAKDDEEAKLQALLEQMETMQTTQAIMQDELQNLTLQGQP